MTPEIAFRPLTETDIPMLKRWLEDPDVAPWYEEDSLELGYLVEEYGAIIRGEEAMLAFVIQVDEQDAGYIQCYVIDDDPDYARQIDVDPGAVGIDLFLGEPWARNRGYGSLAIRELLRKVVFGEMDADVAIIAPEPGNARAIRAYEKVGFAWQKTVYIHDPGSPANTGDEYVMRLTRKAFLSR